MKIQRFIVNMIEENCYLLYDEEGNAALIDCGAYYPDEQTQIRDFITENHLNLVHLLNTHAHFDHLFGVDYIYRQFGTEIEIGEAEKQTYATAAQQPKLFMNHEMPLALPPVGRYLKDGEEISIGQIKLQVIATPGHTPGGICLYCEAYKVLFSGDSLFRTQIGRCDFPGGNEQQLIQALKTRILTLPDDVQVLPGHGESTTIAYEREHNYFLS